MKKFIVLIASLLFVTACATTTQTNEHDYGPNPYRFDSLEQPVEEAPTQDNGVIRTSAAVVSFNEYGVSRWQHFGADPYASSRDDAMEKRGDAFARLPIPAELQSWAMRATSSHGRTEYLVPGDQLTASLSGGVRSSEVHVRYNVVVVDTPGSRNGLSQAIETEVWTIEFEQDGNRYLLELFLPEVCGNWSVRITLIPSPPPPPAECAVVEFDVQSQDIVLFLVHNRQRALTSDCWGVRMEGSATWSVLPVRCEVCQDGWERIAGQWPGRIHLSGGQGIGTDGVFQMRVPLEATRGHISFCLSREFEDGRLSSCSLTVEPRDWQTETVRSEFRRSFFIEGRHWNFSNRCNWLRVS
jgi:hypothetical protein